MIPRTSSDPGISGALFKTLEAVTASMPRLATDAERTVKPMALRSSAIESPVRAPARSRASCLVSNISPNTATLRILKSVRLKKHAPIYRKASMGRGRAVYHSRDFRTFMSCLPSCSGETIALRAKLGNYGRFYALTSTANPPYAMLRTSKGMVMSFSSAYFLLK